MKAVDVSPTLGLADGQIYVDFLTREAVRLVAQNDPNSLLSISSKRNAYG